MLAALDCVSTLQRASSLFFGDAKVCHKDSGMFWRCGEGSQSKRAQVQSPHLPLGADSTLCILEYGGFSSTERTVREIPSVIDIDPLPIGGPNHTQRNRIECKGVTLEVTPVPADSRETPRARYYRYTSSLQFQFCWCRTHRMSYFLVLQKTQFPG